MQITAPYVVLFLYLNPDFFTLKVAPHRRASVVLSKKLRFPTKPKLKKLRFPIKLKLKNCVFRFFQTTPCASMARATFRNPATFAPFT